MSTCTTYKMDGMMTSSRRQMTSPASCSGSSSSNERWVALNKSTFLDILNAILGAQSVCAAASDARKLSSSFSSTSSDYSSTSEYGDSCRQTSGAPHQQQQQQQQFKSNIRIYADLQPRGAPTVADDAENRRATNFAYDDRGSGGVVDLSRCRADPERRWVPAGGQEQRGEFGSVDAWTSDAVGRCRRPQSFIVTSSTSTVSGCSPLSTSFPVTEFSPQLRRSSSAEQSGSGSPQSIRRRTGFDVTSRVSSDRSTPQLPMTLYRPSLHDVSNDGLILSGEDFQASSTRMTDGISVTSWKAVDKSLLYDVIDSILWAGEQVRLTPPPSCKPPIFSHPHLTPARRELTSGRSDDRIVSAFHRRPSERAPLDLVGTGNDAILRSLLTDDDDVGKAKPEAETAAVAGQRRRERGALKRPHSPTRSTSRSRLPVPVGVGTGSSGVEQEGIVTTTTSCSDDEESDHEAGQTNVTSSTKLHRPPSIDAGHNNFPTPVGSVDVKCEVFKNSFCASPCVGGRELQKSPSSCDDDVDGASGPSRSLKWKSSMLLRMREGRATSCGGSIPTARSNCILGNSAVLRPN